MLQWALIFWLVTAPLGSPCPAEYGRIEYFETQEACMHELYRMKMLTDWKLHGLCIGSVVRPPLPKS